MLICTKMPNNEKLGYSVRMGKNKPKPLKLQLKTSDMYKHKIKRINFTPATFDKNVNSKGESFIVTSTGPYIIKWNFTKAKLGFTQVYTITQRQTCIARGTFRPNHNS